MEVVTHELYMIFTQSRQREGEGEGVDTHELYCTFGCPVLLCLVVCLTLLASFFLPSLISH